MLPAPHRPLRYEHISALPQGHNLHVWTAGDSLLSARWRRLHVPWSTTRLYVCWGRPLSIPPLCPEYELDAIEIETTENINKRSPES
jgi:hypothetical protein